MSARRHAIHSLLSARCWRSCWWPWHGQRLRSCMTGAPTKTTSRKMCVAQRPCRQADLKSLPVGAGREGGREGQSSNTEKTMTNWPRFPLIYEINTRVWMAELTLQCGRRVTLADMPDEEFRKWREFHFDAIWLMGVWQPSEYSRELALHGQELVADLTKVLPGWKPEDVASSPYSVADYRVDENLGGNAGLAQFRDKLRDHSIIRLSNIHG
jgi:hypothetical protein